MVWTSPLKVARFVSPKISVRICMEDLQTLRWLWHIMDLWWFIWWYRCFRLSEWFRRVAKKKFFKEISSHIGVCLKIGYPKKSAGWISHRNPHYIQTECLVYNLLHIIHIYMYICTYIDIYSIYNILYIQYIYSIYYCDMLTSLQTHGWSTWTTRPTQRAVQQRPWPRIRGPYERYVHLYKNHQNHPSITQV
jgi:hypothetical protein